jgi:HPt (histidine-containing phosphotransfer) domain-containing protein
VTQPDDAVLDLPVLDDAVLAAITARLGDRATALRRRLLQGWSDDAAGHRVELDRLGGQGSSDELRRVAHAVRSAAATLGARRLAAVCAQVEGACESGRAGEVDVPATARRLAHELAVADAALVAALGGTTAT